MTSQSSNHPPSHILECYTFFMEETASFRWYTLHYPHDTAYVVFASLQQPKWTFSPTLISIHVALCFIVIVSDLLLNYLGLAALKCLFSPYQ